MKKIDDVLLLDEENLALATKAEIDTVSDVIKEFRVLMQMYNAGISVVKTKLETLDEEFRAKYDYNPIHHIESRLKEPRSIFEKMRRMGLPPTLGGMKDGLTDIAGVRVVCNYIQDAEMIAELLLSQDDVSLIKKTDYIHNPRKAATAVCTSLLRCLFSSPTAPSGCPWRSRSVPLPWTAGPRWSTIWGTSGRAFCRRSFATV